MVTDMVLLQRLGLKSCPTIALCGEGDTLWGQVCEYFTGKSRKALGL